MDNIIKHNYKITKELRIEKYNQKPFVIWLTGLSGSGKSTIANELEKKIFENGYKTYILDGDNIRFGINKDLGFSLEDRTENIRRIGEVCKLFVDAGIIVIASFISPLKDDRKKVRELFEKDEFIEIYVKCPLEICEKRDVKGLYKKARKGEIKNFTGIDSVYEEPLDAEIVLDSGKLSLDESVDYILGKVKNV